MINAATFRKSFPEFSVDTAYANSVIDYWIAIGEMMGMNKCLWGEGSKTASSPPTTPFDFGLELFVAHNIALERKQLNASAAGGVPGEATGPTASKSVGQVSISYATSEAAEPNAGHWNLTTYGQRFVRLLRQFGSVPLLYGVPSEPPPFSGPAWPGPYPFPAPGGSGFG